MYRTLIQRILPLIAWALFIATGCSSDSNAPTQSTAGIQVVVSPLGASECTKLTISGGYLAFHTCGVHRGPVVLTASVFNDPSNVGVTWSWSGGHGSVSPTTSASGVGVTFDATAASVGSESVTATSVADPIKSATATVSLWHP